MGVVTFTISPSKALISPPTRSPFFNSTAIPLKFSTFSCFHPKNPKPTTTCSRISTPKRIPARDRVIDLGKYKGKMLGSLPSTYLKWVSKNLRAGDVEEWAKLADEVLSDPVYGDRIEWELAEKILNGNAASPCSNGKNGSNVVTELLEISERFGWDNEDKVGWSKIDFGLLGTSKGGRIPRVVAETNVELGSLKKKKKKKKEKIKVEEEIWEEDGGRRRERRERVRRRRVLKTSSSSGSRTSIQRNGWEMQGRMEKVGGYGNREGINDERGQEGEGEGEGEGDDGGSSEPVVVRSPFPGREALLNKMNPKFGGIPSGDDDDAKIASFKCNWEFGMDGNRPIGNLVFTYPFG
ncbi:hypothetical protein Pfo_031012, partial [Paulownia fortunei]